MGHPAFSWGVFYNPLSSEQQVIRCGFATMSDFLAVSIGFDRQNETAAVLGHVGSIEEDACSFSSIMGLVVRQFERLTKIAHIVIIMQNGSHDFSCFKY